MGAVDEFGYHEAIDRLHVVSDIIDSHLLHHPAIAEAGQFEKLETVCEILYDTYQKVSQASDVKFEKNVLMKSTEDTAQP